MLLLIYLMLQSSKKRLRKDNLYNIDCFEMVKKIFRVEMVLGGSVVQCLAHNLRVASSIVVHNSFLARGST